MVLFPIQDTLAWTQDVSNANCVTVEFIVEAIEVTVSGESGSRHEYIIVQYYCSSSNNIKNRSFDFVCKMGRLICANLIALYKLNPFKKHTLILKFSKVTV